MENERNIKNVGRDRIVERDRIGIVLYVVYLLTLFVAVAVIVKVVFIQKYYEPEPEIVRKLTPENTRVPVYPERGRIIDCQGRILAISCPIYQFGMDCTVLKDSNDAQEEKIWLDKAKDFSAGLAEIFQDKSSDDYYKAITEARRKGKEYIKIGYPVEYGTYRKILSLPLAREGRFSSGVYADRKSTRRYPYGKLARRTIGFVRDNESLLSNTHIGIEGKFDYLLHGEEGEEWIRKTDYGKVRNNDSTYRKAVDGKDIVTTLNIDYQEIADQALRSGIEGQDDLEGGCLVLMEVKSGAIRAMVNLLRDPDTGLFEESKNLAVGRKAEPGSVFKTVTLMSVLSDGYVRTLEQTIPTNGGVVAGTKLARDQHIVDFERSRHTKEISVLDGFKMSSNYVFASLAINSYAKKPEKFIQNIYSYKLGEVFDFDLVGLASPKVPTPHDDDFHWSDTSLGSIGYGYTTEETPLHIITFYNAIANKGRMMKPYLVNGPSVLSSSICSKAVADTLVRALKAVTEDGTAKRLKNAKCSVAGKTGTSFGTFKNGSYQDENGNRLYQGTFVGFFPAENPVFSIICMIYSNPTKKSFQGGGIPAIAVKEVIDRICCIDPHWRTEYKVEAAE